MGLGPVPAVRKVLERAGLNINDMDLIELNEAFAAQALGARRQTARRAGRCGARESQRRRHRVRPSAGHERRGGLALSASLELQRRGGRYALCTMCIGVGQGIAMILERV